MLLEITAAAALIAGYTFVKHEVLSVQLVAKEAATLTGKAAGATPEISRTMWVAFKANNAETRNAIHDSGSEMPAGFREGRITSKKATRDYLREYHTEVKTRLEDANAIAKAREAADKSSL